jgi:hypothetical protein
MYLTRPSDCCARLAAAPSLCQNNAPHTLSATSRVFTCLAPTAILLCPAVLSGTVRRDCPSAGPWLVPSLPRDAHLPTRASHPQCWYVGWGGDGRSLLLGVMLLTFYPSISHDWISWLAVIRAYSHATDVLSVVRSNVNSRCCYGMYLMDPL